MTQFWELFQKERVTIDGTNYILAAGTSDVNSGWIAAANVHELAIILELGVMAASSTVDAKIQVSSDGSTSLGDLEGSAQTQAGASDDNKGMGWSIKDPQYAYYRVAITRGDGGNSTIDCLTALKRMRKPGVDQSTSVGGFVSQPEQTVGGIVGTA